jgi:putative endonuclease
VRAKRRQASQNLGRQWEDKAAEFLTLQGLTIIARGYRCRLGELDIVGSEDDALVVVEVRARGRTDKGTATETVDRHKQQRIILATRHFLMQHPVWHSRPIRFDVVAIDAADSAEPSMTWLKHAFETA